MGFCQNCGAPVEEGKRCQNCGFKEQNNVEHIDGNTSIFEVQNDVEENNSDNVVVSKIKEVIDNVIYKDDADIDIKQTFQNIMNTKESDVEFEINDIEENKVFAILAYLGVLVLIPYLWKKDSEFTQYHAKQGINLAIWLIIYNVLTSIVGMILDIILPDVFMGAINILFGIVNLGFIALIVLGVINVVKGKAKELPFMDKLQLIK